MEHILIKNIVNNKRYQYNQEQNLLEVILFEESYDFSHCGKKGICGRCQVRFVKNAPLPSAADRQFFSPKQLREGWRLACTAKPKSDCAIEVCFTKQNAISILTTEPEASKNESTIKENETNESCMIAIDLGTTTIAMELRGAESGKCYQTFCRMNPQRKFGADVISRMEAAEGGNAGVLSRQVKKVLEEGIHELSKIKTPQLAVLAGNTAMIHLLMEYPVSTLCRNPFKPVDSCHTTITLGNLETFLFPGISAFVGGDITAGLYYLLKNQIKKETNLLIDLGTNGEMVLTDGNRLFVTATAAGPAFEGGTKETVIGTDMIAAVSELCKQKKVDETGLLIEPYFSEGIPIKQNSAEFILTQKDIRALQMAKAAVFAGVCILVKKMGISFSEISNVFLAGGFGYYLSVDSALEIGLLPAELKGKVLAAGNTSLKGSFLYGKSLIKNNVKNEEEEDIKLWGENVQPEQIAKFASEINLAREADFEEIYIEAMNLCILKGNYFLKK